MSEGLPIAKGSDLQLLLPAMANRHGLIAGATGTGKPSHYGLLPSILAISVCPCLWLT